MSDSASRERGSGRGRSGLLAERGARHGARCRDSGVLTDVVISGKVLETHRGWCPVQIPRVSTKLLRENVYLSRKVVHLIAEVEEKTALLRLFLPEAHSLKSKDSEMGRDGRLKF